MNIAEFVTEPLCQTDDALPNIARHSPATLPLSELVTVGVLRAMKNGSQRAVDHWLRGNDDHLFLNLHHRTRLNRRLLAQ